MGEPEYLLTNAREETVVRFDALEETFDELTTRHLGRIGVEPGWRCLELGAGGGSIAVWLATQVGPAGRVVATDIDAPAKLFHDSAGAAFNSGHIFGSGGVSHVRLNFATSHVVLTTALTRMGEQRRHRRPDTMPTPIEVASPPDPRQGP